MRWSRLPGLMLFPLLTALLSASTLNWLFERGWYFVVMVPMAVGGLLAYVTWLTVAWSHCRIPWLATAIGLIVGLVAYLGYFQVSMASTLGIGVHRVDLLPRYIAVRMATDVQEDQANPNRDPGDPDPFMNWFSFVCELLFVAGVPAHVAGRRAMQAYDVMHDVWLKKESVLYPSGALASLTMALENGQTERFCEVQRPVNGNPQSCCQVTLEYTCSDEVSPLERPVYLTATENPFRSELGALFRRSQMFIQREITRDEVLEFQSQFKGLDQTLRDHHEELRDLPPPTPEWRPD